MSRGRMRLRMVPPPPDDEQCWNKLLNYLFLKEQDALFRWLKGVRRTVEEAEKKRRRAA